MVHGGGHHHSHHAGGGGGGFSGWGGGGHRQHNQRSNASNVVIVNNPNPWSYSYDYNYGPSSWWWRTRYPPRGETTRGLNPAATGTDTSHEECERCCRRCCYGALCCWCCMSSGRSQRRRRPLCVGLVLSILLAVLLWSRANQHASWTLNAGETRRITADSFLIRQIQVDSTTPSVRVYNLPKCPALDGPTRTLEDTNNMTLGGDDFQFDYFFLNTGSTISVDLQQRTGATNMFLFQGEDSLKQIEEPSGDDDPELDMTKKALLKRYVADGNSVHVDYKVRNGDLYTLLYDNASTRQGQLSVHYSIQLTTYNLQGQTPACDMSDSSPCTINVNNNKKQCLIVEAVPDKSSSDNSIVSVNVTGQGLRWFWWLFYSSLPLAFCLVRYIVRSRRQQRSTDQYEQVGEHDEDAQRPPATAPPATATPVAPSAPVEAQAMHDEDDNVIRIAAENVIPVPPPKT